MAYDSSYQSRGYGNGYGYSDQRRQDAPLPSIPQPVTSPFDTPFDDRNSPYQSERPSHSSYNYPPGRQNAQSDPFRDNSAVPLDTYRPKHDSQATLAPIIQPEDDDPFVRDAKPGKRRPGRGDDPADHGWFRGRIPWVVYTATIVQIVVFIAELVKNGVLTKSPIEIHPTFNPMIGPSPYVLINMGARYQPCMHNMANVQNATTNIQWPCPNATSTTGDSVSCTLSDLCGFNGVPNPHIGGSLSETPFPNQWWRFIVPIFIHAGIIHIGFNLLLQLTLGRDMERKIGSWRFALVYFAAGIFGFVLGGNFAATGIASTGCSGSLFGILALDLLDLLYNWRTRPSPKKELAFILVDVVIAFVLGLLPGLDNFSHIGGFLIGLVLGVCLLRTPAAFARQLGEPDPVYDAVDGKKTGLESFAKAPAGFFVGRPPLWWVWWLVRVLMLVGTIVGFIVLLKNFYVWRTGCSWCKYLSCLDVNNWCDVGNLDFTSTNGSSTKRDLLTLTRMVFEGQA